jgi:uncharacterized damage-inducible protein DinB
MTTDEIRLLFEYNAWADRRTLEACAALTSEQFTRELGGSFPSVRDTLVHILWGEWLWLERWHGRSHGPEPPWPQPRDFAELRSRWPDVERGLRDFAAGLTPSDLERVIEYRRTTGSVFRQPLQPMLQHLVNHGTYHRGQVAMMLRQLGGVPLATDYIVFERERTGQPLQ